VLRFIFRCMKAIPIAGAKEAPKVLEQAYDDIAAALLKLHEDNSTTLTPDPVYVAFHYSHPPALERISRLRGPAHRGRAPAMDGGLGCGSRDGTT